MVQGLKASNIERLKTDGLFTVPLNIEPSETEFTLSFAVRYMTMAMEAVADILSLDLGDEIKGLFDRYQLLGKSHTNHQKS